MLGFTPVSAAPLSVSSIFDTVTQVINAENIVNDFNKFNNVSTASFAFTIAQNLEDVSWYNRVILKNDGWGEYDIMHRLSAQENINYNLIVRADGALFSIYDDTLSTVVLQDPVSVNMLAFKAVGSKPTARMRVKTFNAPLLDKSVAVFEPPKKKLSNNIH